LKTPVCSDIHLFPPPRGASRLHIIPYETLTSFGPIAAAGAAHRRFTALADRPQKPDPKCSKARPSFRSPPCPANSKTRFHYKHFTKDVCFTDKYFTKDAQKSIINSHCVPIEAPGFTGQTLVFLPKHSKSPEKLGQRHGDYARGANPVVMTPSWPAFSPFSQLTDIIESSLIRSPGRYRL
jgi:hypothetical protein